MGDLDRLERELHKVIEHTFALARSSASAAEIAEQENALRDHRTRLLDDIDRLLNVRRNLLAWAQRASDVAQAAITLSTLMANVDQVYHSGLEQQFIELEAELSEILRQS